jgi:hypothetical protein
MANTFKNAEAILTGTTVTDLYQAPATAGSVSIVLSVLLANRGGSSVQGTVLLTNSSNTILSYILNACPVPVNTALEVVTNKIVLQAGEKLRVQASAANLLDATLSCLEITP